MPLTLTTTPPLFSPETTPSRTAPDSAASSISFQLFAASRRFLESITVPSTSLTLTTTASMVSPTLTTSSTLTPSSVNSEVGMKPEYLVPRSTLISVPVIATTCPVTLSPLYIVLRVSSSISSKDFSASTADSSTLISSLILFLTSLIIHARRRCPRCKPDGIRVRDLVHIQLITLLYELDTAAMLRTDLGEDADCWRCAFRR